MYSQKILVYKKTIYKKLLKIFFWIKMKTHIIELTPFDISNIKNSLLFPNYIEPSFSLYKSIERPNCWTLNFENLQMYIISTCFQEDNNKYENIHFLKKVYIYMAIPTISTFIIRLIIKNNVK